jgi:hypothetical protein
MQAVLDRTAERGAPFESKEGNMVCHLHWKRSCHHRRHALYCGGASWPVSFA